MKKKTLALVLSLILIVGGVVGGSIAWLTDTTSEVENTFTVGKVDIDLTETTTDYKMVPGNAIEKDPTVTVKSGSEECWLFVKVEESANLDTYIDYAIADGWTELEEGSGVYYREVAASQADTAFSVLNDNKVSVKETVTTEQMEAAGETAPTLTFTAYAIQKANIGTAAEAWAALNPTTQG